MSLLTEMHFCRSIVEAFVAGGRAVGLTAFVPKLENTGIHLFASNGSAAASAEGVAVWQMGCGWNETRRP